MSSNALVNKLARAELVTMVPYQSARRLFSSASAANATEQRGKQKIWLNANEACGPGIYQLQGDCLNRYPDFQPENLLSAYSEYCRLPTKNILATRGADEGIELIIRTFCRAYRDSIIICPPTYGMYAISAENHGANVVCVPLANNQLDMAALTGQASNTAANVKVVFLCSPGNPTGNLLSPDDIRQTLELFKEQAMVVVDEAYIEFCPEAAMLSLLTQYENLIVLRTLSKAFALAGLRCGFTLASADIITMLSKVIAPYPISAPVAALASNVLSAQGIMQMACRVNETTLLRQQLIKWLAAQPWCTQVHASDANFVLFKTTLKDEIFSRLAAQGILIRDQSKQPQLQDCLRISIGSERELSLLRQILTPAFTSSETNFQSISAALSSTPTMETK